METKVQTLEKRFKRYPLLKIDGYEHNPEISMKKFIHNFFTDLNESHYTSTVKSDNIISDTGRYRSIIDVYGLCRNYYPGCTLEEVLRTMFDLSIERKIFGRWFCGTINRYVFSPHSGAYEQYVLRMAKVSYHGDIIMADLVQELGYKLEDFLTVKRKPETAGAKKAYKILINILNKRLDGE